MYTISDVNVVLLRPFFTMITMSGDFYVYVLNCIGRVMTQSTEKEKSNVDEIRTHDLPCSRLDTLNTELLKPNGEQGRLFLIIYISHIELHCGLAQSAVHQRTTRRKKKTKVVV